MATVNDPLKGKRLTRKKTYVPGYRIPVKNYIEMQVLTLGGDTNMTGTVVDRLGEYEDIGTVKEFRQLKETYGKFVKK